MANQRSSHDDDMVLTTQESTPSRSRRCRRSGLLPMEVPTMLYAVHCLIHSISFLKPVTVIPRVIRCLLTDAAPSGCDANLPSRSVCLSSDVAQYLPARLPAKQCTYLASARDDDIFFCAAGASLATLRIRCQRPFTLLVSVQEARR